MPAPTMVRRCWSIAALAAGVGSAGVSGARAQTAEIREWKVPWEQSRPRDPFLDRDGHVWFVGQAGNYVAWLDPKTGRFRRYELDPGTFPHNLIVDAKGFVWYAGNGNGTIGRLDPATGRIARYSMPMP